MERGRTLVIGDIHGALRALEQCLERSGYEKEYDQLIFLGDYVDGWSESAELVDFLIDLESQAIHKPIFLRGNHDEWCREWLNTGVVHPYWLQNGGQSTKYSYLSTSLLTDESHRKFFRTLHNYYIDDQNRGFVHGGFVSHKGLGHDSNKSNYYWDRDLWSLALISHNRVHEGGPENIRRFEKHSELFIGHTSTTNWDVKPHYKEYNDKNQPKNGEIIVPMNRCNVWNLDTGGGWMGKLTIMDVDTKEYFQSDYVKELYPNEKGR